MVVWDADNSAGTVNQVAVVLTGTTIVDSQSLIVHSVI
jgi:hypothetical protein